MKRLKTILLLCAVTALCIGSCSRQKVDEYATVMFMIGDVTRNNAEVEIGDIIREKDVLKTGADSFCDIKIGSSVIRIKEKTTLVVSNLANTDNVENTTLGLEMGKMLCKPKKLLKNESFLVKTPTAVAGVRGTNFTVETDAAKTTRIKVFDGQVKIARRIRQFENNVEQVMEVAPVIATEQKVVITLNEVEKAERTVERELEAQTAGGGEVAVSQVIHKVEAQIVVPAAQIATFEPSDFAKEKKEIIEVAPKPAAVITRIANVIKEEKQKPQPEGRLLITRYDIYFIKNGKVLWEGRVVQEPLRVEDRIFIAYGDMVFCASVNGPVYWRKKLENEGTLRLNENRIMVMSQGREIPLDPETGEQL